MWSNICKGAFEGWKGLFWLLACGSSTLRQWRHGGAHGGENVCLSRPGNRERSIPVLCSSLPLSLSYSAHEIEIVSLTFRACLPSQTFSEVCLLSETENEYYPSQHLNRQIQLFTKHYVEIFSHKSVKWKLLFLTFHMKWLHKCSSVCLKVYIYAFKVTIGLTTYYFCTAFLFSTEYKTTFSYDMLLWP